MTTSEKRTRIWLDGCFDSGHFAHFNAVRQALTLVPSELPVHITVGVHSDAEILKNKGPPLFGERERYDVIRGCRWVDQVVEDVPYVTQLSTIDQYNIDFVVHGDDPVLDADGNDCYAFAKAAGRYVECKRTAGISTTSLIERILHPDKPRISSEEPLRELLRAFSQSATPNVPVLTGEKAVLPEEFPATRALTCGAWDCFGAGHVELLRRAREAGGGSLIVGVWDDATVEEVTGEKPLLAHLERALALVQCRHVDAVILHFPRTPSLSLLSSLGVSNVVTFGETYDADTSIKVLTVDCPPLQTVALLREKVHAQLQLFEDRQRRKGA
ncbi:Nucleotidylyl transferase [Exidia glandulosa HHB12029]|uniref:ethanolamine-phosphate cytidylyltransferase n=1 Tax=Exidia glandulosa HHB12029 TaxID=1314781 RepID=A0A165HVP2_EXIGL|nr:Nucleotidylyl transferase [Exidia glandulosa HHB12029]